MSLNPCCSGQWSRTALEEFDAKEIESVLILVVVDNGLVPVRVILKKWWIPGLNPCCSGQWSRTTIEIGTINRHGKSLNPCCSGQWSRTRPYKTLLIINKLKSFTKQIFTFLNRKLTIS